MASGSTSMAWTCSAPLSASWIACRPLPQPTSRQLAPRPMRSPKRWRQTRNEAWAGHEDLAVARRGPGRRAGTASARRVDPRLGGRRAGAPELVGTPLVATRRPRPCPGQGRARRGDLVGPDAAAAPDQLGPLLAPAQGDARERRLIGVVVDVPAVAREVAEVRVDPERQVREVAQVGEHPVDVVGRDAAQQQRADAELLEAPRPAPERVALRAAPVLAVDAAQAVAAAAERQPHRQPEGHQRLDRRVERRAHDGQALDERGRPAARRPARG